MKNIAVLASGRGSNLEAILEAESRAEIAGRVILVISDRADAQALTRADKWNKRSMFLDPGAYSNRVEYDRKLISILKTAEIDLVVLAGYMRLLSPEFVKEYSYKIMNIHPSLLPAFPGTDGAGDALDYGVKISGCTVHFVDEGLDTGPIILQESVPVIQDETLETLKARINAVEHRLYPTAIDLFCRDKLKIEGRICNIVN